MRLGTFIIGEYRGLSEDTGFGQQLRVRTGQPTTRSPQGYETKIDFFVFNPNTGAKTLPDSLRPGDYVRCEVRPKAKAFNSATKGLSAMNTYDLVTFEVLDTADID